MLPADPGVDLDALFDDSPDSALEEALSSLAGVPQEPIDGHQPMVAWHTADAFV